MGMMRRMRRRDIISRRVMAPKPNSTARTLSTMSLTVSIISGLAQAIKIVSKMKMATKIEVSKK
jgi:hypothetical protein